MSGNAKFRWFLLIPIVTIVFALPSCVTLEIGPTIASQMENHYSTGHKLRKKGRYKEAQQEYTKLMNLARRVNDELNYSLAKDFLGSTSYDMKDYENAIKLYKQSINFYKKEGNYFSLTTTYTYISLSYSALKQYKKAVEFDRLRVEVNKTNGDKPQVASAYSSIGNNLWHLGKYEKSIENKEKAISIYKDLGDDLNIASTYTDLGNNFFDINQKEKAFDYLTKALEINRNAGREDKIASTLDWIGVFYRQADDYDQAIISFKQALRLYKKLGDHDLAARTLIGMGTAYNLKGNTEKALDLFEQALEIFEEQNNEAGSVDALDSMAGVYQRWGQYDKAIEIYKRELEFSKKKKDDLGTFSAYLSLGDVYSSWAKYDVALKFFKQALDFVDEFVVEVDRKKGLKDLAYTSLGGIYLKMGKLDEAIKYLSISLQTAKETGSKADMANILKIYSGIHRAKKDYEKSLALLQQSLKIYTEIGMEPAIARSLMEIGNTYHLMKNIGKAWEYLNRAVEISKKIKSVEIWKDINESLAALYIRGKNYKEGIRYLTEAINIVEDLRLTATGNVRRDFFETELLIYKFLALSHLRNGDLPKSFSAIEQSRSRLLMDKLLDKNKDLQIPTVNQIQKQLGGDSAILAYGRLWPKKKGGEILFEYAITGNNYEGYVANTSTLLPQIEKLGSVISKSENDQRGIKITKSLIQGKPENYLENLVRYYHSILANPSIENDIAINEIGRSLYDLLIKPLLPVINGKKNLLIVPDGPLSLIPFETLIDENGDYLIEKFNVHYIQSIAVANLLRERKYDGERQPMLAFGGAIYDQVLNGQNTIETDVQLSELTVNTLTLLDQGNVRSASEALGKLGYGSWSNLPGTKVEVEAINTIVKNTNVVMGRDVNESNIKKMSASGELGNYKVLHFATHGMTVPNFPELSSIVLSQVDHEQKTEDGYLRMEEIAKLKIRADFVNLSACQTGLGKLYAGEGVVGLTHSFLLAGANALSASLWSVEDESTVKFMIGLYKLVEEKGMTYFQAINEMKRSFIRGEIPMDHFDSSMEFKFKKNIETKPNKLSHPFYWAPFVYYGNN
jgi:tetratricopeptide (TPR) repeat protein